MALQGKNLFFGLLGIALAARGAGAQVRSGAAVSNLRAPVVALQAVVGPQSTLEDELRVMSDAAGVIFAGQVLSVKRQNSDGMDSGFVDVEFRVEEAIRGCVAGATYQLREWTGLWAVGTERYRVGQRLLMLLHAPGASGLSSPVGGQDGVIPITGLSAAPRPEDGFADVGERAVDLRWIQTRLLRSESNSGRLHGDAAAPVGPVYVGRKHLLMVTRKNPAPAVRNNLEKGPEEFLADPPSTTESTENATLQSVLAMLGAWETRQANAAQ